MPLSVRESSHVAGLCVELGTASLADTGESSGMFVTQYKGAKTTNQKKGFRYII
jgi:hypothetical protein